VVSGLESNAAAFLAVAALGIAGLLAGVSAMSWKRLRHPKLLFVSGAFAVLAAKGLLDFLAAERGQPGDLLGGGLLLAAVLLLYGSVAAR
jgi:hypothetical protein